MMFDEEFFNDCADKEECIYKLLKSLEALSWLHNCSKIQITKGLLSHNQLIKFDFWMVVRGYKLFYSKNRT